MAVALMVNLGLESGPQLQLPPLHTAYLPVAALAPVRASPKPGAGTTEHMLPLTPAQPDSNNSSSYPN